MSDLKNPLLIHLKGWSFLLIVLAAATCILVRIPSWHIAALLILVVWASARFYYYLFYVIENYLDPHFKFTGVFSAIRYFITNRYRGRSLPADQPRPPDQ